MMSPEELAAMIAKGKEEAAEEMPGLMRERFTKRLGRMGLRGDDLGKIKLINERGERRLRKLKKYGPWAGGGAVLAGGGGTFAYRRRSSARDGLQARSSGGY